MQLDLAYRRSDSEADGTCAAAEVNNDRSQSGGRSGLLDEELGPAARDEDAGIYGDAQAAELCPAEDVLERKAGHSSVNHVVEVGWCSCGRDEQLGLVLGEDAAGSAELVDDVGAGGGLS